MPKLPTENISSYLEFQNLFIIIIKTQKLNENSNTSNRVISTLHLITKIIHTDDIKTNEKSLQIQYE